MSKNDGLDVLLISGSTTPQLIDDKMKDLARQVAALLGVDHYLGVDGGAGTGYDEDAAGEHAQVTLHARTSPNTVEATKGVVFTKTVDGVAELFYIDENEAEVQITRGGLLLLDDSIIANLTPLQADNEAGDGTVDLIQAGRNEADDADVAMLPDETRLDSDAAPTEDTQLVNMKYINDQLAFSAKTNQDADSATLVRDVTYTATSDGFVTATGKYAGASNVRLNLDVNGDSVAKTTLVNNNDDGWVGGSVAKGETFKIGDSTGDPTTLFIFWRSRGPLSKPTKP